MHRPDHSSADPDAIDTGKAGYTDGDPGALPTPIPPTTVVSAHMNDLGESLCVLVEGVGLPLIKGDYTQVLDAVQATAALPLHYNWTAKTNDGSYTDDFLVALWTGYDFVIAGETGEIQSSPTGHTWTNQASSGAHTQTFRAGCVGGGKVYLCTSTGSGGQIDERPASGGSWTTLAGGPAGEDFYGIAHDGTDLLAVGEDETPGNVPVVFRNGLTFDTIAGGLSSQRFIDICVGDGGEFVVLGRTAANGFEVLKYVAGEWVVVGSGAQTVDRIVWNETFELYVIVGANATLTSPTGATWTSRTNALLNGAVASLTQWRHVIYATTDTGRVSRSLNGGVTWTRVQHDFDTGTSVVSGRGVVASDKRLVMAGTAGVIAATEQVAF